MVAKFLRAWLLVTALLSSLVHDFCVGAELPIGSGDTIVVTVYNEPDLSLRVTVNSSGYVNFPLIGPLTVVNKTPSILAQEVASAYENGYLVQPNVTVQVESYRPFYIRGAVNKPGSYPFLLDLTLDQALAVAGGLKDRASQKQWFIIRGPNKERIQAVRDTKILPGDIITIEESLF